MRKVLIFGQLILIAASLWFLLNIKRVDLPPHLINRTVIYKDNFLTEETRAGLADLLKKQAIFPTNAADTTFFEAVEDIGEAIPIGSDGRCSHPFLVPNSKRTKCVIPGRIDVARGFIKSGGPLGFKEFYEKSVSRLLTFGRYNFDLHDEPIISQLFQSDDFLKVAKAVCPSDRQYLDPFQYNFIIQLEGQTVATHLDAIYFESINRFSVPQWLLMVIKFSGLFEEQFINQVQVVAYLHQWEDNRGGNFIYWNDNSGEYKSEAPKPRAGSAVDGSSIVHAGDVYRPDSTKLPQLDKSKRIRLEYNNATSIWSLMSNDDIVKTYTTDDLRQCIVYRAKCFENEAAAIQYNKDSKDKSKWIPVDTILTTLGNDLIQRGRITKEQLDVYLHGSEDMPKHEARLEYGLLLVDEYVKYPLPPTSSALIPFNYCAAAIKFPFLKPILQPFCA